MNVRPTLIALLAATTLTACDDGHDHDQASEHMDAPESAHGTPPASNATEAFYGDEAPVIIAAVPQDDHGHDHGEEDAHAHGEHDEVEEDAHDHDEHDHDEGSEPHAH